MRLRFTIRDLLWLTLVVQSLGCSSGSGEVGLEEPATGRVFGGPVKHASLEPFQGTWQFKSRRFEPAQDQLHISGGPDISIVGHIVRFAGGREIRLCQITNAPSCIMAEGWHHEDVHDPGDMQRTECELRIANDDLEMRWRLVPDSGFNDDPVFASAGYTKPARSTDEALTPWWIETYSRKAIK